MSHTRLVPPALLVLAALWPAAPAAAQQTLVPTPYPSAPPGGTPLNPSPAGAGSQQLMQDPYPQDDGPDSQGNPPTAGTNEESGQQLVPSINQRKYDVDRAPR